MGKISKTVKISADELKKAIDDKQYAELRDKVAGQVARRLVCGFTHITRVMLYSMATGGNDISVNVEVDGKHALYRKVTLISDSRCLNMRMYLNMKDVCVEASSEGVKGNPPESKMYGAIVKEAIENAENTHPDVPIEEITERISESEAPVYIEYKDASDWVAHVKLPAHSVFDNIATKALLDMFILPVVYSAGREHEDFMSSISPSCIVPNEDQK